MSDLNYRRVRGMLTGIFFILMGWTIYHNPTQGTAAYLTSYYGTEFISLGFIVSGFMVINIGMSGSDHNGLWYASYYSYVTAIYITAPDSHIPIIAILVYTLLGALFALDIASDMVGRKHGRTILTRN